MKDSRPGKLTLVVKFGVEFDVEVENANKCSYLTLEQQEERTNGNGSFNRKNSCLAITRYQGGVMTRYQGRMKATSLPHLFQPSRTLNIVGQTLVVTQVTIFVLIVLIRAMLLIVLYYCLTIHRAINRVDCPHGTWPESMGTFQTYTSQTSSKPSPKPPENLKTATFVGRAGACIGFSMVCIGLSYRVL